MLTGLMLVAAAAAVQVGGEAQRKSFVACLRSTIETGTEGQEDTRRLRGARQGGLLGADDGLSFGAGRDRPAQRAAAQVRESDADQQIADYMTSYAERIPPTAVSIGDLARIWSSSSRPAAVVRRRPPIHDRCRCRRA
jgi:hypothetical protein